MLLYILKIFVVYLQKYVCGRCMDVLKWKPPSLNSVDFKLQIVREHKMGYVTDYITDFKNIVRQPKDPLIFTELN